MHGARPSPARLEAIATRVEAITSNKKLLVTKPGFFSRCLNLYSEAVDRAAKDARRDRRAEPENSAGGFLWEFLAVSSAMQEPGGVKLNS